MRRRTLRAVLVAYLLVVARITLWPQLAAPDDLLWVTDLLARAHALGLPRAVDLVVVEALANVALFVPLGVLLPATGACRHRWAVAAGLALSTGIELTQAALLPERVATVQDVAMNGLGAALGAGIHLLWRSGRLNRASAPADIRAWPSSAAAPRPPRARPPTPRPPPSRTPNVRP